MHPRRMHIGRRGRNGQRWRYRGRRDRDREREEERKRERVRLQREKEERERLHSESLRTNCNITIITRPLVGSSVHPSVCQNVLTLQRYQRTAGRSWRLRYAHSTPPVSRNRLAAFYALRRPRARGYVRTRHRSHAISWTRGLEARERKLLVNDEHVPD